MMPRSQRGRGIAEARTSRQLRRNSAFPSKDSPKSAGRSDTPHGRERHGDQKRKIECSLPNQNIRLIVAPALPIKQERANGERPRRGAADDRKKRYEEEKVPRIVGGQKKQPSKQQTDDVMGRCFRGAVRAEGGTKGEPSDDSKRCT